jgi:predicted transposase YbfD/YdcC
LRQEAETICSISKALDIFVENDKSHGRKIKRITEVFSASEGIKHKTWEGLTTYIRVTREREKDGKVESEIAYFMSNMSNSAEEFHRGIREHWGIENMLHWVKDVIHQEDNNLIRCGSGPIAASIFSTIALNIHRKEGNASITHGQILFRANVESLFNIIRT